ncbi:MAG TPA: 23S rRNA (adenine(2503)-C(2))-methyltransferase RlmN [Polyangiaceae bacterium]|nr:23S rRNA (adenine(2503)-C(2))-methyltransferase RlmN [Polyangiaceae bacterium]
MIGLPERASPRYRREMLVPSATLGEACDSWALEPAELDALATGVSGRTLFSALQRPWRWHAGRPALGARAARAVAERGAALPSIATRRRSSDGAEKLVLVMPQGGDGVEAVHMPRPVGQGRVTLCVSSQVGCALGCAFCATAALGLGRHLSAGEIIAQVLLVLHELGPRHPGDLSLVFMGMGEPLHNFENVVRAVRVLTTAGGLGLSPRRITLSTAGLVPAIAALARVPARPLLAVSLNATRNELRDALMPINRRYPLEALIGALERYPCRPRERITIEYVLLAGVNDEPADAARLAELCAGFPHHVNVIPFNSHPGARFQSPSEERLDAFLQALVRRRPTLVTVRRSRGGDVDGACGQLAGSRRLALAPAG